MMGGAEKERENRKNTRQTHTGPDQGDPEPRRAEKAPVKAGRVLSFATRRGSPECPDVPDDSARRHLTGKPEPIRCWNRRWLVTPPCPPSRPRCHHIFSRRPISAIVGQCHHSRVASPQCPLHSHPPMAININERRRVSPDPAREETYKRPGLSPSFSYPTGISPTSQNIYSSLSFPLLLPPTLPFSSSIVSLFSPDLD